METALWPTAAKNNNWFWGVVKEAERFVVRWQQGEAESSWARHSAEDANSSGKGTRVGGGVLIPLSTRVKRKWQIVRRGSSSSSNLNLCYPCPEF